MNNTQVQQSNSKTYTLNDLFDSNFFIIPDYQRGYSWETEHLEDLVKDIENISRLENSHYTGTIVATLHNVLPNTYELVDGQQRLTTLVILLSEIYHSDPLQFKEIESLFLVRGSLGNERTVFTPNKETRDCFEQAIINRNVTLPSIKSHEAILNAQSFFKKWLLQGDAKLIYYTIVKKLNFLFFTPSYNKEIGIMFEVINNRGKQLSELEKIKNFFIYYSTIFDKNKLRDDINLRWADIQKNLSLAHRTSNDDENAFLRNCYLVYFATSKDKSWYVYDECKVEFDVKNDDPLQGDISVAKMRGFVEFLANASLHYAWFFNNRYLLASYSGDLKDELYKCIKYLKCQPVFASIMPLYLSIMTRLDKPEQVVRMLELLEIVNMRLYVLPDVFRRSDSKQADLFGFAYEFYNDQGWNSETDPAITAYGSIQIEGDIFEWLYHNLAQITYTFCSSDKFIDNLFLDDTEQFNFYQWQGVRYFLACYEEEIKNKRAKRSFNIERILSGKKSVGENFNDQLSLEHIWASKNREDEFPTYFHTKRRLGNFVLCGLSSNISLSNSDIPNKIELLTANNKVGDGALDMLQISELSKILDIVTGEMTDYKRQTKNYWRDMAIKICDKREELFLNFALKRWRLPNEKIQKRS